MRVWTFHLETDVAFRLICDNERRLRPGAMTNACLSEDDRATRRVIDATSERETALALQNVSTTSARASPQTAS